jgi:hypothetical protein
MFLEFYVDSEGEIVRKRGSEVNSGLRCIPNPLPF